MEYENLQDAEAAFHRGCQVLAPHGYEDRGLAEPFFEAAARGSGPLMLWRVAEAYAYACNARADAWMRRAIAADGALDGIAVDPGTLRIVVSDNWISHQLWELAVRSEDRTATLAALTAAEPRLMWVLNDGREVTSWEEYEVAAAADPALFYSPNSAALDAEVPSLRLDCKDGVMPLMARTMIRVVAGELRAAGVREATIHTP